LNFVSSFENTISLDNIFADPIQSNNESVTHNFLSQSDPIAKDFSQKSSEFDFKSPTAFKDPLYRSPPIYNSPTISSPYNPSERRDAIKQMGEGLVQMIVALFQILVYLFGFGIIIGFTIFAIYYAIKSF
jgi:hypothetical protein